MFFENVNIMSMTYLDAPHVISSASLEASLQETLQRLGMRPNLIESLTGIQNRRFWDAGAEPNRYAAEVAQMALEQAGISKEQVGVLISCSVYKDFIEPSIAALVHGQLGLSPKCLNFDISNACLGFLNSLEVAGNMIERGQIDYALITSCESAREINELTLKKLAQADCTEAEFRARFATLTLGSAAVAMVIARKDLAPEGHPFLGGVSMAATQHSRLCLGHNHDMQTDARGLLAAGVELAMQTYAYADEEMNWSQKEFQCYIMHQVGAAHLKTLIEVGQIPPERVPRIYQDYGNTGSTTVPLTLIKAAEQGQLRRGERIALMGIGSGINCSMMEIIW